MDLFEYEYSPNEMVEVSANSLLNIMLFCQEVVASQPTMGVPYAYPDNVELEKDKDGNILSSKVDWKSYGAEGMRAFFQTVENPIPFATRVSIIAEQIYAAYAEMHMKNIEKGLAKKRQDLEDEQVSELLVGGNKKEN